MSLITQQQNHAPLLKTKYNGVHPLELMNKDLGYLPLDMDPKNKKYEIACRNVTQKWTNAGKKIRVGDRDFAIEVKQEEQKSHPHARECKYLS